MKKILLMTAALMGCDNTNKLPDAHKESSVKETVGYRLTVLESGNTNILVDDPDVLKLNTRIDSISKRTGLLANDIGNMAYYVEKQIKDGGKPISINNMLEAIEVGLATDECINTNEAKICISEYLASYATVRLTTEQSHEQVIKGFSAFLKSANTTTKRSY